MYIILVNAWRKQILSTFCSFERSSGANGEAVGTADFLSNNIAFDEATGLTV